MTLTRLHVLLHRVTLSLVKAVWGRQRQGARPGTTDGSVQVLLLNAHGMGGATRSVFGVAGELARTRPVEITGVVAGRTTTQFPFPDGCTLSVLDDRPRSRSLLARARNQIPSLLMHPEDATASGWFSAWTDLLLLHRLRSIRSGVVMTTRPTLSVLAGHVLRPEVVHVVQEHLHHDALPPEIAEEVRQGYAHADVVSLLTDRDREQYASVLRGPRIITIPNGVPRLFGRPVPAGERRRVVVAAGRLVRQKGFDLLLEAFVEVHRQHPDWALEIYGQGGLRADLESRIAAHGLQEVARLAGPTQELGEVFAHAAVFALSSRAEGLPQVLLEAMSKGAAVVAYDCPTGPREVLTDGHDGLLLPPEDVPALTAGLLRVIEDVGLRARLGAAAQLTTERYSLDAIGQRWRDLFDGLVSPSA